MPSLNLTRSERVGFAVAAWLITVMLGGAVLAGWVEPQPIPEPPGPLAWIENVEPVVPWAPEPQPPGLGQVTI